MHQITYRKLTTKDCERIKEMDASQFIKRAWREVEGERRLVEINYLDPTWPGGFEDHYNCLKETIEKNGSAIGAFDSSGNQLVGFITVDPEFFGDKYRYVLLDQLYVSRQHRSQGIGKKLFTLAAEEARGWKAEKFYIAAGSAEETIAFYFALGCREAVEINQEIYESDPRDYQMEYTL
jgi:predicted N-acetyltransferase YhbS